MASGVYICINQVENNESISRILDLVQGSGDSADAPYNRRVKPSRG
jgi:hypothetical protein